MRMRQKLKIPLIAVCLCLAGTGGANAQTGLYYLQGSEDFEFEGFPNLEVLQYQKVSDAVQALAVGNIQIVCADKDVLELAVNGVNR